MDNYERQRKTTVSMKTMDSWLSIASKIVPILFVPSLWVFHLYLGSRFEELRDDLKGEFVQQDDAHVFARSEQLVTFKTKVNTDLQSIDNKVDINQAKADALQANIDLRLDVIKEDVSEIKEILLNNN